MVEMERVYSAQKCQYDKRYSHDPVPDKKISRAFDRVEERFFLAEKVHVAGNESKDTNADFGRCRKVFFEKSGP